MPMKQGTHHRGRTPASRRGGTAALANGLGWFSVGLGLAEILAPEAIAEAIGASDGDRKSRVLRFYGLREIGAGIGILSQSRPAGWLWGRVAGDILDLASLGAAMHSEEADRRKLAIGAAAVVAVTALDVYCAREMSRGYGAVPERGRRTHHTKSIAINRPPEEVYSFWRNVENFPRFMNPIESVQAKEANRSHWKAKGPAGTAVEWDSEIIKDEPNSLIAWRSLPGSEIDNSGSVRFERAAGGRGTILRVDLAYTPPGGAIGANIAKLFGAEPGQQVESALRLLKQILETGDIMRSDASIHPGMHPARPPSQSEMEKITRARARKPVTATVPAT